MSRQQRRKAARAKAKASRPAPASALMVQMAQDLHRLALIVEDQRKRIEVLQAATQGLGSGACWLAGLVVVGEGRGWWTREDVFEAAKAEWEVAEQDGSLVRRLLEDVLGEPDPPAEVAPAEVL